MNLKQKGRLNAKFQNKVSEACFTKCISKPGTKLDSSDETCLSKCMDRYLEAWDIVSKAYVSRIQKEVPSMKLDDKE
ncbi:hypothetical protein HMI55_001730 [Coelomomyces lativittatus]|nr:hypothetical protein HMI55_001730 [Coelomomyces lativittatus]